MSNASSAKQRGAAACCVSLSCQRPRVDSARCRRDTERLHGWVVSLLPHPTPSHPTPPHPSHMAGRLSSTPTPPVPASLSLPSRASHHAAPHTRPPLLSHRSSPPSPPHPTPPHMVRITDNDSQTKQAPCLSLPSHVTSRCTPRTPPPPPLGHQSPTLPHTVDDIVNAIPSVNLMSPIASHISMHPAHAPLC